MLPKIWKLSEQWDGLLGSSLVFWLSCSSELHHGMCETPKLPSSPEPKTHVFSFCLPQVQQPEKIRRISEIHSACDSRGFRTKERYARVGLIMLDVTEVSLVPIVCSYIVGNIYMSKHRLDIVSYLHSEISSEICLQVVM